MSDTAPKPFVFVLMPFSKSFDDVYQLGIRDACVDLQLHCERVDEQLYEGTILNRIYNQISKADIIVADMTGRNPNVFYETGYAHALNKTVILLTQRNEDIPFDLLHYPHVVYGSSISSLKLELSKRLRWCVEHPRESLTRVDLPLDIFVGVQNLAETSDVLGAISKADEGDRDWPFAFSIHNRGTRVLSPVDLRVGLVVTTPYSVGEKENEVWLPDGRKLYLLPEVGRIFPDGWQRFDFELHCRDGFHRGVHPVVIRTFTELGANDFPLRFTLVPPEEFEEAKAAYLRVKGII